MWFLMVLYVTYLIPSRSKHKFFKWNSTILTLNIFQNMWNPINIKRFQNPNLTCVHKHGYSNQNIYKTFFLLFYEKTFG